MNALPASVYTDFQGLAALKHQARQDQAGSLAQVARQFESLFMQMMLKQMRQANLSEGLLESSNTRFYRDMYDQQLALHLSESGGLGIGAMLQRQLGGQVDETSKPISGLDSYRDHPAAVTPSGLHGKKLKSGGAEATVASAPAPAASIDTPEAFVRNLWSSAEQAAAAVGVEPEALLAQAALETGWGQHLIHTADGRSSHNLFNIKADARWQGERAFRETLEYIDGVAVKRREAFRVYDSYQQSFQDYLAFLSGSPRYAEAMQQSGDSAAYFSALQQAGYATDPHYAKKVLRVMGGEEMRQALVPIQGQDNRPI